MAPCLQELRGPTPTCSWCGQLWGLCRHAPKPTALLCADFVCTFVSHVHPTSRAGTAGTYPHMQLVLAALGLLLTRTQAYLTGPLAANLTQGAQQLAVLSQQQGVNVAEVRAAGQARLVCVTLTTPPS